MLLLEPAAELGRALPATLLQAFLKLLFDTRLAFEQLEVSCLGAGLAALEQAFDSAFTQHLEPVENAGRAATAERGDLGGLVLPFAGELRAQ